MKQIIKSLDEQFEGLHQRSRKLIAGTPADLLYRQLSGTANSPARMSGGEIVLRSAGVVEQTFGGLSSNLWDDPFEWTLPETLGSPAKVIDYLDEVAATRSRGFTLFQDDADLLKDIVGPAGNVKLANLLLDTLWRAAHYLGAAEATFKLIATR
jgi:hypothetical protein